MEWERYNFKDLGLITADKGNIVPKTRSPSVLFKGKRSNNIRGGALLNIGKPFHTYNLFLPSDSVSLSHWRTYAAF